MHWSKSVRPAYIKKPITLLGRLSKDFESKRALALYRVSHIRCAMYNLNIVSFFVSSALIFTNEHSTSICPVFILIFCFLGSLFPGADARGRPLPVIATFSVAAASSQREVWRRIRRRD